MNPIAYFDLDGTLVDYDAAMQRDLARLRAPSEPNVKYGWGDTPSHILARMDLIKIREEWWENLPRFQLGWDVLEAVNKIGFRVMVLTQGPRTKPAAWSGKVKWCAKHLPDTEVIITRDKGLNYGRVLVDDYPEYVQRWLEWRPRGIVIMPANDYNDGFEHERVVRYDGSNLWKVKDRLLWAFERNDGED